MSYAEFADEEKAKLRDILSRACIQEADHLILQKYVDRRNNIIALTFEGVRKYPYQWWYLLNHDEFGEYDTRRYYLKRVCQEKKCLTHWELRYRRHNENLRFEDLTLSNYVETETLLSKHSTKNSYSGCQLWDRTQETTRGLGDINFYGTHFTIQRLAYQIYHGITLDRFTHVVHIPCHREKLCIAKNHLKVKVLRRESEIRYQRIESDKSKCDSNRKHKVHPQKRSLRLKTKLDRETQKESDIETGQTRLLQLSSLREDGCWILDPGSSLVQRPRRFLWKKKEYLAHRLSYILFRNHGKNIPPSLLIRNICGSGYKCINPDHLEASNNQVYKLAGKEEEDLDAKDGVPSETSLDSDMDDVHKISLPNLIIRKGKVDNVMQLARKIQEQKQDNAPG